MKDFAHGMALIAAQAEIIEAARNEQDRLKRELVERFSPVHIGDIVTVNSGYAHEGKQMRITEIAVRVTPSHRGAVGFIATGDVLKKDGTPGANRAEHYAAP